MRISSSSVKRGGVRILALIDDGDVDCTSRCVPPSFIQTLHIPAFGFYLKLKYGGKKLYTNLLRRQLLAGIPSIICGLFGLIVIVPFVREVFGSTFGGSGQSILTVSLLLGVMIWPSLV